MSEKEAQKIEASEVGSLDHALGLPPADEPAKAGETPRQTEAGNAATAENSSKQVDKAVNKENEQGFAGVEVDPTPNENYTIAGVTGGKPTPETDDSASAKARKAAGIR